MVRDGGVQVIVLQQDDEGQVAAREAATVAFEQVGPHRVDSCFIFRKDRRCIHDLIAGTQVVTVAKG